MLHGAQEELIDFDIGAYEHVDSREREWAMNWKLVMDTFTEPYHIPWLHKDSIAPYYLFDRWIHDAYGPHPALHRLPASRCSTEFDKPSEDDWDLLPHGTIQYLLVPNAVLVHQIDHLELWRFTPLAPDRTIVRTSVYSPRPTGQREGPALLRQEPRRPPRRHRPRGLPGAGAGPAQPGVGRSCREVVYGKMEPALAAYHTAVDELLAAGPS